MKPNKYIVYIDQEWWSQFMSKLDKLNLSAEAKNRICSEKIKKIQDFINGDIDSSQTLLATTFIASDGRRRKSIEIKSLSGQCHRSGRVLKRLKKCMKKK